MNVSSKILKQEKKKKIFMEIYKNKSVSKNSILKSLNYSLPTISQNLVELERSGLIKKEGLYQSTGGRPATIYKCNKNACISIGIDLHTSGIEIAAINMYGEIISESSIYLTFIHSDKYFRAFGDFVNHFLKNKEINGCNILGIGIGLPGIIAPDGNHMLYSEVLKYSDFTLSDLTQYIEDVPCFFYHNAEAGAHAEIWHGEITRSTLMIILDNYLCNAIILNGKVYQGYLSSGTLEHMTLHPDGKQCYCGKKGCVDSYCSAASLIRMTKQPTLDEFFIDLRKGDKESEIIWDKYLHELALTIDNSRMIIAGDIILSGLVQNYIIEEDLKKLKSMILEITTFKNADFNITSGNCGRKAIVIGAALPLINNFIDNI